MKKRLSAGTGDRDRKCKNNCMDIEEYEPVKYTTEKFRKLYRTYEETKKKYRKIDFEDMLIQCRDLL